MRYDKRAMVTKERRGAVSTSERILDAAEELVQRQGFNGFSYADIAAGQYQTLDLTPLGFDRIERGEPIRELNVV